MMHGFLLLDKSSGEPSFRSVIRLRKRLGLRRVGFAGTLDPLATGLMIFAVGEYTKLLPYLEAKDKVYETSIVLGAVSDTYDADGDVTEVEAEAEAEAPSEEAVRAVLEQNFMGVLSQVPPAHSAVQIDGMRAYDLARKGEKVELKPRQVEVFSVEILEYAYPLLRLRVHCAAGTYIRSIAHDLGQELGCGGYVKELRRMAIGDLSVDQADEEKFYKAWEILSMMPVCDLSREQYEVLALGNFVDLEVDEVPALARFEGECVGALEKAANGQYKFKKRLLIDGLGKLS